MLANIDIDDELMERAFELTGLKSKQAVVEEALITLVRQYEQAKVKELRSKLKWESDENQ